MEARARASFADMKASLSAKEAAARAKWAEPGTHRPTLAKATTRWHFFLSHTQRNGAAVAMAESLFHSFKGKNKKCWLDVKMPKADKEARKHGVNGSK